jgi:hypothetical protein
MCFPAKRGIMITVSDRSVVCVEKEVDVTEVFECISSFDIFSNLVAES